MMMMSYIPQYFPIEPSYTEMNEHYNTHTHTHTQHEREEGGGGGGGGGGVYNVQYICVLYLLSCPAVVLRAIRKSRQF